MSQLIQLEWADQAVMTVEQWIRTLEENPTRWAKLPPAVQVEHNRYIHHEGDQYGAYEVEVLNHQIRADVRLWIKEDLSGHPWAKFKRLDEWDVAE